MFLNVWIHKAYCVMEIVQSAQNLFIILFNNLHFFRYFNPRWKGEYTENFLLFNPGVQARTEGLTGRT